jgi:uncharacterized RDD family membrane protein YckC
MKDDVQGVPSATVTQPPFTIEPGGMWRRFVAQMLDWLIITVILSPLTALQFGSLFMLRNQVLVGGVIPRLFFAAQFLKLVGTLLVLSFYFGWFYKNKGASPGKKVMGLKILNASDGTYPGYGRTIFRETIGKGLSWATLGVGFLVGGMRQDKKALHDLLSGTQVIHQR